MGAAALLLEDQVAPKRCGHLAGKAVVSTEEMVARLRVASATRSSPDLFLIARTDTRAVHGLDDALRRAERYLAAGADGLFIEAPESIEELERIGRAFDVPQMCNMLVGGKTPLLSNQDLYDMGFQIIVHGTTLISRVAQSLLELLPQLRDGGAGVAPASITPLSTFVELLGRSRWADIEERFKP
jgi:2-methylisocitrate lyase-like PEP mutase family enzyme